MGVWWLRGTPLHPHFLLFPHSILTGWWVNHPRNTRKSFVCILSANKMFKVELSVSCFPFHRRVCRARALIHLLDWALRSVATLYSQNQLFHPKIRKGSWATWINPTGMCIPLSSGQWSNLRITATWRLFAFAVSKSWLANSACTNSGFHHKNQFLFQTPT